MIQPMSLQGRMASCRVENLRAVQASSLQPLLEEEKHNWRARLHWDFGPSAELVTRYVNLHALDGLALMRGLDLIGYCYWVAEEHKALIGDLYVRDAWRSIETQGMLLDGALHVLRRTASLPALAIRRVESQLMQLADPEAIRWDESEQPTAFPRVFMLAHIERPAHRRAVTFGETVRFIGWAPVWTEPAAELVVAAYRRHVDAQINDQYRNPSGAVRFLRNIVNFPGCGVFQAEASFVALDAQGEMVGCVVTTRVAEHTGHIAQLCIAPNWQRRGLGYELLRRAIISQAGLGCDEVSLTVTEANLPALRLYEHMGFREIHRFDAFVWDD